MDDEREVLDSVSRDLAYFSDIFNVEACESADECLELIEELNTAQEFVGVIISDHVMPGKTGVEMLIEIEDDPRFMGTKKMLLTGLATQQDTIAAINQASLDHFLEKVWDPEELVQAVKELITTFIVEKGIDHLPYTDKLDAKTLSRLLGE